MMMVCKIHSLTAYPRILDMRVPVKLMRFKSLTNSDSKTRTSWAIRVIFIKSYLSEFIPMFHVSASFLCSSYINEHSIVLVTMFITRILCQCS